VRHFALRREPALRRLPDLRSLGEEGCEGGRRSLVGLDGLPSVAFLTFVASAKKVAKGGRSEGNANFKSVPRLGGQSRIMPPGPALGRTTNTPLTSSRRNPGPSLVRLSRTIVHGSRTMISLSDLFPKTRAEVLRRLPSRHWLRPGVGPPGYALFSPRDPPFPIPNHFPATVRACPTPPGRIRARPAGETPCPGDSDSLIE
jgi:hypothetical protein